MDGDDSERIAALMRRFKSRDTKPELRVRSALHHLGLRFRIHRQVEGATRRTIDIAFPRERIAVFVDGCYWHGCPEHGKTPARNSEWWREKLHRNVRRDRDTDTILSRAGWIVLRYWEHQDPVTVATEVEQVVRTQRLSRSSRKT